MLKFKKVEDKDIKRLQKFTKDSPYLLCDYSAGVIYMWKDYLKYDYAILNDTLILKTGETIPRFFKPIGKNVNEAYKEIENYCVKNELPLTFVCVEEEDLNFFIKKYGDNLSITFDRDYSDYIYLVDEIKTFQGKKFSGQRNHINAFKRENPNYQYKKITKSDLPKLVKFLSKYKKQHQNMKSVEKSEFLNTISLTKKFFDYNFVGGYIEVDGEIVSMAIGEYCGKVIIIHVEKALVEYRGVYPTMFNEFIKNNQKDGVIYINREDDAGDLGLRTSKTQYKPVFLKSKFKIKIDKKMTIKTHPTLRGEKVVLNKITKKDSLDYFKLYTQVKNNKFWGYDYKKDLKTVNEDTFYLLQKKDFKNKNNMCLAIRKRATDKLIGEVVLYNFDYDNFVEVGIRLFKKEQGKGYAKESLTLIENYVKNTLGLKILAKCYKQNSASKNLFLKSGYKIYKEDNKYIYFKK